MITKNIAGNFIIELNDCRKFHFVRFIKPVWLLVWEQMGNKDGWTIENCRGLHVKEVDKETLESIEVWDKLALPIKSEIENSIISKERKVNTIMEKARASRGKKYANIPREITCTICKAVVKVSPGALAKKIEKLDVTIEKFIGEFKCTKCCPVSRGRKPNPAIINLPHKLVCSKCNLEMKCSPYYIIQRAKTKNTTTEEFTKNFICQSCKNTKFGNRHKQTDAEKVIKADQKARGKEMKRLDRVERKKRNKKS